jgi:Skp family chaperone for outer membrane proteins
MMNKKVLVSIGLSLLIANLAVTTWQATHVRKVAYVRSTELVYGYFGMTEAMNKFEVGQRLRQSELDTLSADLQNAVALARQFAMQKDEVEFNRMSAEVTKKRNELMKHSQTVEQRSSEEEQKILGGVLSQVNAFVESYAQEKGYDIILGTTADGSLLYGESTMDITNDVLLALNQHHEGL